MLAHNGPMQMIVWSLLALIGLVAAALGIGAWRWERATAELVAQLQSASRAPAVARVDLERELAGLPPPVQRYFRAALTDGMPIVRGVTVTHHGRFNMGADPAAPQWKPFTSRQTVVTSRPGFVWDGRISMVPGIAARVHDAYVAGEGRLHATAAGLVTLADLRGTPEVDQGELMRYLAEAAWVPTALLPSQGVRWTPVDHTSADASLRDGDTEVTLRFTFGADGLVRTVRSETRGRQVDGRFVPTPWEGRWSNVQQRGGMWIPIDGEVAWLLDSGELPYWRGTITDIAFEPAR